MKPVLFLFYTEPAFLGSLTLFRERENRRKHDDRYFDVADNIFRMEMGQLRQIESNKEEFYKEGTTTTDTSKFWDYKLENMKKMTDRVKYTIDFSLTKIENEWN